MKLKTNLIYDFRPHFTRRVWIDENVDLFIMLNKEKCIIEPTNYHLKLPGNIRYSELGSKEVKNKPIDIETLGLTEEDVEEFGKSFLKNVDELAEIDEK